MSVAIIRGSRPRSFSLFASLPLSLALLIGAFLAATPLRGEDAPASKNEKHPGRTEISDEPWSPESLSVPFDELVAPKVIYGTDDRIDVYQEFDPVRRQLAAATCALVESSKLTATSTGFNLSVSNWRISGLPPCADEPFGTQPVAAFCSGFLVAPDIIVTAGHCYDSADLNGVRFVFGFEMTSGTTPVTTFTNDQVYRGIQVISQQLNSTTSVDYSVIKLDRPVTAPGAAPLQIRRTGAISLGTPLGVIGHPAGLPKKIAFGSTTAATNVGNSVYFTANLDTYGGNSGSPVFNATTGVVEGILVRGARDYDTTSSCFRSNRLSDAQAGEESTRSTVWAQYVPVTYTELGSVNFDREIFVCGSPLSCAVTDGGLQGATAVGVAVTTNGGDAEWVVLSATSPGSAVFAGALNVALGAPIHGDGVVQIQHGNTITVTYQDADTGSGSPGVATDTATVDCIDNDYFTQFFEGSAVGDGYDLDNTTLTLTPNGSPDFYSLCRAPASAFPTSPTGGTVLTGITDDGQAFITLSGGARVGLYGQTYPSVSINANGFVTLDGGVQDFSPSLEDHFSRKQISAAFTDFDPSSGGQISYRQLPDRFAVTWNNVPRYNTPNDINQFQLEMFFDGVIRITHLRVDADSGLVGVSAGGGVPADYRRSDLSAYPGCVPNGAIIATSLPSEIFPNQTVAGTITVQNTGATAWDATSGITVSAASDSCGIIQPSQVAVSGAGNTPPGGVTTVPVTVRAPGTPGYCGVFLTLQGPGGAFGQGTSAHFFIQESFNANFASAGAPGWTGATILGGATPSLESGAGLCLSTPTTGENIAGWFSGDAYLPLVDLAVIRASFNLTTNQTNTDQIPLLDITYDNFYSTGTGPVYGGELIVIDVAGGANGVGRPQGRSSVEIWAAPNAALTQQWRGALPAGNENSAFTPVADPLNDMRLGYRTLDLDSASILANMDSGKVCIQSLSAQRYAIPALQVLGTLSSTNIHAATHGVQTTAQSTEPGDWSAYIIEEAGAAVYKLGPDIGVGGRKTLFPFQMDIYDPNNPAAYAPFYPIGWSSNALYMGTMYIASFVNFGAGPDEGVDPPDTIFVNFDTATSELVNLHFTTRGAPLYFERAASPRLYGTTGGAQPYVGFFFGHNTTAVDLNAVPNANRLRLMGDFINTPQIAPQGVGADPFVIYATKVEVVSP